MEKLELKHLTPYLPYGVNVIFNNEIKGILCGILTGLLDLEVIEDYDNNTPIIKKWCSLDTKLILRSLSDLTKEIEYYGERFVPIERLIEDFDRYGENGFDFSYLDISTVNYPYYIISKLFEWHFDVFGLIDKGLAIDVSSLK